MVEARSPTTQAKSRATVDVTIRPTDAIGGLLAATARLDLPLSLRDRLLAELGQAERAFANGRHNRGVNEVKDFIRTVRHHQGDQIGASDAAQLISQARFLMRCLRADR